MSTPGPPAALTMMPIVGRSDSLPDPHNSGDNQSDLDSPNIQRPHQYRFWSETSFGRHYENSERNHRFVITSYNILAQSLLERHSMLYSKHDEEYLQWPHRLNCIVQEITELRPAILTLQEVQDVHLDEIETALATLQYAKPLYKQRTAIDQDDGCAIFYDPKKFRLIDHQFVEYYQPGAPEQLDRTNVAIIARFASNQLKDSEFIVATTHLLFNPRRDDVRIAQIQVLLAELDRLAVHSKTMQQLPIILTGDFNSQQLTPPYRLITDGCIDSFNLPMRMEIMDNCQHFNVATNRSRSKTKLHQMAQPGQPNDEPDANRSTSPLSLDKIRQFGLHYDTGQLWHKFYFTPTIFSEWAASTFQNQWIIVDYIFYTKFQPRSHVPEPPKYSQLQLLANYRLPSMKKCERMGPIPNEFFGSDHYLLAAEFVLLK